MYKILSIVGIAVILSIITMGYAETIVNPSDGTKVIDSSVKKATVNFSFNSQNQIDACKVSVDNDNGTPGEDLLQKGKIECKLTGSGGASNIVAKSILDLSPTGIKEGTFVTMPLASPIDLQLVHGVRLFTFGQEVLLTGSTDGQTLAAVNFVFDLDNNTITGCKVQLDDDMVPNTLVECKLSDENGIIIAAGSFTTITTPVTLALSVLTMNVSPTPPIQNVHDVRVIVTPPAVANICDGKTATIFKKTTSILDNTWVVNGADVTFSRWDKNGNGTFESTEGWIVLGTNRDDVIVGSDLADRIEGMGGNDSICGRGGDDFLRGEGGDDVIFGEDGNDLIRGEGGVNVMYGGNGDDELHGHGRNDTIFAGPGNDRIFSYGGDDTIHAEEGDDAIDCGGGTMDFADGGDGFDIAVAGTCETALLT